ncbi:MAG: WecB/TagA/CpsF family glycosyltransferase [Hyphomonadaceae bacterium]|nr:WecB/TagA/CpsF family glycosyltransferase [Hyphomonadaceae bacterium]
MTRAGAPLRLVHDADVAPQAAPPAFPTVRVGGFDTIIATRKALAAHMVRDCLAARADPRALPKLVFSSNGQGIALAGADPAFAAAMAQADMIHADGMPVVHAARLLTRTPLPERIATTDFFHDAAQAACAARLRFFLLGGDALQNERACEAARRLHPGLAIVGNRDGYFPDSETDAVCRQIRDSGADVLWVALGKPKQELWSLAHRDRLRGVGWIKTCGGLYAFLAGDAARAPRWMQRAGLEWAHRMGQEPGRLAGRYLTTNAHALWRLATRTG